MHSTGGLGVTSWDHLNNFIFLQLLHQHHLKNYVLFVSHYTKIEKQSLTLDCTLLPQITDLYRVEKGFHESQTKLENMQKEKDKGGCCGLDLIE